MSVVSSDNNPELAEAAKELAQMLAEDDAKLGVRDGFADLIVWRNIDGVTHADDTNQDSKCPLLNREETAWHLSKVIGIDDAMRLIAFVGWDLEFMTTVMRGLHNRLRPGELARRKEWHKWFCLNHMAITEISARQLAGKPSPIPDYAKAK